VVYPDFITAEIYLNVEWPWSNDVIIPDLTLVQEINLIDCPFDFDIVEYPSL
jgi:hypothetical protein